MNALSLVSESDCTGPARLSLKEAPIWEFVEADKFICPVLHNQITLGNNVLYTLLDYGNEFIENIPSKEIIECNTLSVIDTSVNKNIVLRQHFDLSEDRKD